MPDSSRLAIVGLARGTAIAGVVLFHLVWDLEYVDLISGVARHPLWHLYGRLLAMTFMTLVGVSLVLAHRNGRGTGHRFWSRLATIGAAALAISVVTFAVFPDSFVYFGILHAIAAATLVGRPLVNAPLSLVAFAASAALVAPYLASSSAFDPRWLAWTGFAAAPPASNDFVPVFPSIAFTLAGIFFARSWLSLHRTTYAETGPARAGHIEQFLVWLGRHSLAVYLLHQPVLLGAIFTGLWLVGASGYAR